MKVRFLADADLNKAIISGVLRREPAIDFLTAHAAGLRKMKDLEVLALAAEQRRVLVSHDVGTTPAHFREFRDAGKHSTGVFLIAQSLDTELRSKNSCSSGWHLKHPTGRTSSNGCPCKTASSSCWRLFLASRRTME